MKHISLAHGNGGRLMRELIEELFQPLLSNPLLDTQTDAVSLPPASPELQAVFTTDSFTVQPLEFPGGDIGSLAVHGTINDLAVAGATPAYLSLNVIAEEGLEIALLKRVIQSLSTAAKEANVAIVTGDTKVVPKGQGGGLYLITSGIGYKPRTLELGLDKIRDGDAILVSGPVGDHGIAVMLAREQFGLQGDVHSDAASVQPLTQALRELSGLRFMRDPTRGGIATVLNEIHRACGMGIRCQQPTIPVRNSVTTVCEMLGYDPLYLACEGRVVAVVDAQQAQQALKLWQACDQGRQAAIIGYIRQEKRRVVLETELGGERVLEELEEDPLPRIC